MQKYVRFIALIICLTLTQVVSAGILKRPLAGTALVIGGAAAFVSIQKNCHSIIDPDTGKTLIHCSKSRVIDGQTDKSSSTYHLKKALNDERTSAGLPPDPKDCDAHHIVPKSEGRAWAKDYADSARESLRGCVDIDSAANGVFLPGKPKGSQCDGSYHKSLHTEKYYFDISQRLQDARSSYGCQGVQDSLKFIKEDLSSGLL